MISTASIIFMSWHKLQYPVFYEPVVTVVVIMVAVVISACGGDCPQFSEDYDTIKLPVLAHLVQKV